MSTSFPPLCDLEFKKLDCILYGGLLGLEGLGKLECRFKLVGECFKAVDNVFWDVDIGFDQWWPLSSNSISEGSKVHDQPTCGQSNNNLHVLWQLPHPPYQPFLAHGGQWWQCYRYHYHHVIRVDATGMINLSRLSNQCHTNDTRYTPTLSR